jgi:hypothetical protein
MDNFKGLLSAVGQTKELEELVAQVKGVAMANPGSELADVIERYNTEHTQANYGGWEQKMIANIKTALSKLPSRMDTTPPMRSASLFQPTYTSSIPCPPPVIPKLIAQNPHANMEISYAFYDTDSIKYSTNGDVDTSTSMNYFSSPDVPTSGIFKLTRSEASVSAVTLSVTDVLAKIIEKITNIKQEDKDKLYIKLSDTTTYAGRDNVAPAYKKMYEEIIKPLTSRDLDPNGFMSPANINSFFILVSAIKAILDSGPLGEIVLTAMDYNLVPCFSELAINDKDITDYLKILTTLETQVNSITPAELIKCIDFWLVLEYCRVFQLVSSDIIGAINGLIPLRAIIDHTPFTGFINIPRGSGGQIALDNKVCLYSLFLNNVLFPPLPNNPNFFPNVKGNVDVLMSFHDLIEKNSVFIKTLDSKNNIMQIERSITNVIAMLKTNTGGILKGSEKEKSGKFLDIYNTYKLITIFADFIKDSANASFFDEAFKALNNSYDVDTNNVTLTNSSWITWVCFQLTRYQQTQKVYPEKYEPAPSATLDNILADFNQRKNTYCVYIKTQRAPFAKAWYKALRKVYIYEAFCGHDNNSPELTKVAIDVFSKENKPVANTDEDSETETETEQTVNHDDDLTEFLKPFIKFDNNSLKYVPSQVSVIKRILQETNCTAFSDLIGKTTNTILWTVGINGLNMIDARELNKIVKKIPMNYSSIPLLDTITGEKSCENNMTKMALVVDLAKYTPFTIMAERGIEELERLKNVGLTEAEIIKNAEESERIKNADLILTNELVKQNLLSHNNTVITVYIPIFSGADAAAFSTPNCAVYSTGILKLPIDVGNNITMVITLKTGDIQETEDSTKVLGNNLYIKKPTPVESYDISTYLKPSYLNTPINVRDIDPNFVKCFNYFLKITQENKSLASEIGKELPILTITQLTKQNKKNQTNPTKFTFTFEKPVNSKNFPIFLGTLLSEIYNNNVSTITKYNDYYLFLKAAIPRIKTLDPPLGLFDNQSLGAKWYQLIQNMASIDLKLAQAFIETILLVPDIRENTGDKITKCKVEIANFIEFLSRIQPTCPTLDITISAQLQTTMEEDQRTFCELTIKDGKIHLEYSNIAEQLERVYKQGRIAGQSELNSEEAGKLAFIEFALNPNLTERKRKHENVNDINEIKTRIEDLNTKQKKYEDELYKTYFDTYHDFYQDDNYRETLLRQITIIKQRISKYEEQLLTTPQGGGGGVDDETIDKLEEELAQLERTKEELLISKIKFSSGPISELELTKLALLLGPELFEKVALSQTLAYKVIYNKQFDINAGNVPFVENENPGEPKEVIVSPADVILPEGTTIEDFNNKLVTVKFDEGKYYIEDAETFFNEFNEKYHAPSSGVEEVTATVKDTVTNAVASIEDTASNTVASIEDTASNTVASIKDTAANTYESVTDAITDLFTPKVEKSKEFVSVPEFVPVLAEPVPEPLAPGEPVPEPLALVPAPVAAAAGGSNKKTKKYRNRVKKITKRAKNKHNHKRKKLTKRYRNKKPKKTIRKY